MNNGKRSLGRSQAGWSDGGGIGRRWIQETEGRTKWRAIGKDYIL